MPSQLGAAISHVPIAPPTMSGSRTLRVHAGKSPPLQHDPAASSTRKAIAGGVEALAVLSNGQKYELDMQASKVRAGQAVDELLRMPHQVVAQPSMQLAHVDGEHSQVLKTLQEYSEMLSLPQAERHRVPPSNGDGLLVKLLAAAHSAVGADLRCEAANCVQMLMDPSYCESARELRVCVNLVLLALLLQSRGWMCPTYQIATLLAYLPRFKGAFEKVFKEKTEVVKTVLRKAMGVLPGAVQTLNLATFNVAALLNGFDVVADLVLRAFKPLVVGERTQPLLFLLCAGDFYNGKVKVGRTGWERMVESELTPPDALTFKCASVADTRGSDVTALVLAQKRVLTCGDILTLADGWNASSFERQVRVPGTADKFERSRRQHVRGGAAVIELTSNGGVRTRFILRDSDRGRVLRVDEPCNANAICSGSGAGQLAVARRVESLAVRAE